MFIGEVSTCESEPDNAFNKYAVAIKNEADTLLDMYLKSFQKSLTSFLKDYGEIEAECTGNRYKIN